MKKINKQRVIEFILNKPKFCLFFALLLSLSTTPFIFRITSDFNPKIWFRTSDPVIKDLELLEKTFGNDERVLLVINSKTELFTPNNLKVFKEITDLLWQVPHVVRVQSLTNYPYTQTKGDELTTDPFIKETINYSKQSTLEKKNIALNDPVMGGLLVNKKGTSIIFSAYLAPQIDTKPNYDNISVALKKITAKYNSLKHLSFHFIGSATVNSAYQDVAFGDIKKLTPLIIIATLLFLFFSFKTLESIVLPTVLIFLSTTFTFGLCGLFNYKFDNLSSAIPGILIAISIADSVHLLWTFYAKLKTGLDKTNAVRATLEKNFMPTFMTSFSTMIGFLSLATTELLPVKHLGTLAGLGTLWAWFITIFAIAPLLLLFPHKQRLAEKSFNWPKFPIKNYISYLKRNRTLIVFLTSIVTLLALYVGCLNEVNTDPYKHFTKGLKIRQDFDFIAEEFAGIAGPEIIVDSGEADMAKNPLFLKKVQKFIDKIEEFSEVNKVSSILDVIKKINKALNLNDPNFYKIPDSQKQIAENLLLYSFGLPPGQELNNLTSIDNRYMRLSISWTIFDAKRSLEKIALIEKYAKDLGLKTTVTGKLTLYHRMNTYIVATFFKSITLALILISLLLLFILRSWKLGLLSLLPNVIPLIFGTAIMTLLGMSIDLGTSLFISVCLGIAVDDTIHFLTHYVNLARTQDIETALFTVFKETGPSLLLTTIILIVSFGLFAFGEFVPNIQFGVLCSIILTFALFIDLFFLPAIILKLKIKS